MSKKISLVVALVGMCALSLFLLNCGSSSSRPSGVLYVLTQGTNGVGNNVSFFDIDLNSGNLSLVNSNANTCSMPGACGAPLDILLDPTGATAFVLNQGIPCFLQGTQCVPSTNNPIAPSIYSYTVNSDGGLSASSTPVTWTCINVPTPCTGYDTAVAMARDAAGQFLFVIDQGVYPSPTNCPPVGTLNPSDPIYAGCPSITVFGMKPGSTTLTPESGSPFYLSKSPTALSAITVTPVGGTAEEFLFVTNNLDICAQGCGIPHNDNTVSVYTVSSAGALTEQTNSPYTVAAVNPISVQAVNTNPAGGGSGGGLFVYVGNQGSGSGALNPFQVCIVQNTACSQQQVAQNLMVPLTCPPQPNCSVSAGQDPVAMVVDPTNNFLYAVSEGTSQIFGFQIGTSVGTLTALNPANFSTGSGSQPGALALHPSVNNTGQFLFVSNGAASNLISLTLNTTSGAMSNPITVMAPATPSGIAVH